MKALVENYVKNKQTNKQRKEKEKTHIYRLESLKN